MLLSLLAGCGCPTFADMEVRDPAGLGDAALDEAIVAGIADFAAWTGREGVCVPAVEVREDVLPAVSSAVGRYRGPKRPILVEPGGHDVEEVVRHELCHALDFEEGHSVENMDLFPPEDIPANEFYVTDESRSNEAFARACERVPDLDLPLALEARCGDTLLSARDRYLHDIVWSEADALSLSNDPRDVRFEAARLDLDVDLYIQGTGSAGGDLLLAVDWHDPARDHYVAGVVRVRPGTGELDARLEIPSESMEPRLVVAASDDGVVVIVGDTAPGGADVAAAYTVDLEARTVTPLVLVGLPSMIQEIAVSEGVLYAIGAETTVGTWDLDTGAHAVLTPPGRVWSALRPTAGGIEAHTAAGFARYDRATDAWEVYPPLANVGGFARLSETERLFAYHYDGLRGTAVLDLSTRTWHLASDPCVSLDMEPTTAWADVGGSAWALGGYSAERPGAGVPLYRFDPVAPG